MNRREFASGRFEVVRDIGRGGMGAVYEVYDRAHDLHLALKTVTRLDPYRVIQLKREFRAVAGLRHQNLVQLYELVSDDEGHFFTMELLRGVDMRAWVQDSDHSSLAHADTNVACAHTPEGFEALSASGPLPVGDTSSEQHAAPRALRFDERKLRSGAAQLAGGLSFLHEHGVVHRDVKPSNVLVAEDERVVLLDFGLAADWRPKPGRGTSSTPPLAGTMAYMAPEYLHGQVVSPAQDAYALGVVLFELVAGAPPFSGSLYDIVTAHIELEPPSAASVNPDVPRDLDTLIADLLAKDPASRPTAAQARARALCEPEPGARGRPRGRPPLVGRAAELGALDELADARAGGPRLTIIEGPPGAGKTALLEEFLRGLPLDEVVLFRGRCYEREAVPFRAFDEIAEELAAEYSAQRSQSSGNAALPRHASSLALVFPAFAAVADPEPALAKDAQDERERALDAFADVFALRLRGGVGVLAIDDLQWADPASLELLSVLCDPARSLPLAIVTALRKGDEHAHPVATFLARAKERGVAASLTLPPLTREDLRQLIHAAANRSVGDDTLEAIADATGGLPYAASAIASELADRGASPAAEDLNIPELEAARIERLAGDERRVADAASAATGATSFAELRAATELPGARLLSALHALERERLLRASSTPDGEVGYEFYHDRLQTLVYDRLSPGARSRLHRRLAAAMGSHGDLRSLDRQSRQWELGGEPARAAKSALAAARQARRQLAFERAAELYGRALELGELGFADRQRARERRAEALLLSNEFEEAAARCRELAEEAQGRERDRWLVRCAEANIKLGDLSRGVAALESVLHPRGLRFHKPAWSSLAEAATISARVLLAPPASRQRARPAAPESGAGGAARARFPRDTDPPSDTGGPAAPSPRVRGELDGEDDILSEVYRVIAYFMSTPAPRESWEFVLRFVDDARRRGDRGREACGFAMLAGYLEVASLGRFGGRLLDRARRAAAEASDPYADLVVEAVGVMRATVAGDFSRMREHAERGESICRQTGMDGSWEASFLRTYHGLGEMHAGDIDSSLNVLRACLRRRRRGDLFSRVLATATYGRALLCAGRVPEADEVWRELAESPIADVGAVAMWLATFRGELALARGAYEDALGIASEMRRLAIRTGLGFWPVFSAMRANVAATAQLGLAYANPARARSRARRARRLAESLCRGGRRSLYEPTGLRLLAQAHHAAGDRERARRALALAEQAANARGGGLERLAIAALRGDRARDCHPALDLLLPGKAAPLTE